MLAAAVVELAEETEVVMGAVTKHCRYSYPYSLPGGARLSPTGSKSAARKASRAS